MMSVVIAVRIPKALKEQLDRLNINYAEEIRKYLKERVKREILRRLVREIRELRKKGPKLRGNLAAKFIREDRDMR